MLSSWRSGWATMVAMCFLAWLESELAVIGMLLLRDSVIYNFSNTRISGVD
jgi:predicted nuclease with RNAse H fold